MASRPVIALLCVPPAVAAAALEYLNRRGYDVRVAAEEWQAGRLLEAGTVDVAITGPGESALTLLRSRPERTSFLVLTSGAVLNSVLALELGASDAVEMTVAPRELAARVAGLLARNGHAARELLRLERSTIDLKAALVMRMSGEEELLSPGQVAMLRLFMAKPHKVLTRDDIIAAAPAEAADAFDRSIDSRIVRLRRKLDTDSIVTVRGAGYRFDPPLG